MPRRNPETGAFEQVKVELSEAEYRNYLRADAANIPYTPPPVEQNVTPSAPLPELSSVKDTLVVEQESYRKAREYVEKRSAELNEARLKVSEAVASGKADPSAILHVSRQIDIEQAKLNTFTEQASKYGESLEPELLKIKTYGGY